MPSTKEFKQRSGRRVRNKQSDPSPFGSTNNRSNGSTSSAALKANKRGKPARPAKSHQKSDKAAQLAAAQVDGNQLLSKLKEKDDFELDIDELQDEVLSQQG